MVASISGRCAIYSLLEANSRSGETRFKFLHLDRIVPFRDQEVTAMIHSPASGG